MMLFLYFGRRFLQSFVRVLGILTLLIYLIQVLENVRGLAKFGVSFSQSLVLASTSSPGFVLETLPIIIMLAALTFCVGLARSNEFVVSRAVGVSALRAMVMPAFYTGVVGLLVVMILNPLAASFSAYSDVLKAEYLGQRTRAISFGADGFWLRQKDAEGHTVIHAATANRLGTSMSDATVLRFDSDGHLQSRLHANRAILRQGEWILTNGKRWDLTGATANPEENAESFAIHRFSTDITRQQILEGLPGVRF